MFLDTTKPLMASSSNHLTTQTVRYQHQVNILIIKGYIKYSCKLNTKHDTNMYKLYLRVLFITEGKPITYFNLYKLHSLFA